MNEDTVDRWLPRLERAANLLSTNLETPPDLESLAAAANVSSFHFHRIWRAMTGTTVGDWTRAQRISRAARALVETGASVTEIALAAGFSTSQNFSKAFRRERGVSPSDFRDAGDATAASTVSASAPLVTLVVLPDLRVVAKRREGLPYEELNAEFGAVWAWAASNGHASQLRGIYGIPYDDDRSVEVGDLRYDACMDFGDIEMPTAAMLRGLVIPGGEHACFRVRGSYSGLEQATQAFVRDWFLRSGREPGNAPMFQHFLNDPDETPEADLLTDVYFPLGGVLQ